MLAGPRSDDLEGADGLSFCNIVCVLSLNIVVGLIFNSLSLTVVAQLHLLGPKGTAEPINSSLVFVGALINLISSHIGRASDERGRRPVLLCGAMVMALAATMLLVGVYCSNTLGLVLFLLGYIVLQVGMTMLSVMISALVSDFSSHRPEWTNQISSAYYLLFNTGSIIGVCSCRQRACPPLSSYPPGIIILRGIIPPPPPRASSCRRPVHPVTPRRRLPSGRTRRRRRDPKPHTQGPRLLVVFARPPAPAHHYHPCAPGALTGGAAPGDRGPRPARQPHPSRPLDQAARVRQARQQQSGARTAHGPTDSFAPAPRTHTRTHALAHARTCLAMLAWGVRARGVARCQRAWAELLASRRGASSERETIAASPRHSLPYRWRASTPSEPNYDAELRLTVAHHSPLTTLRHTSHHIALAPRP